MGENSAIEWTDHTWNLWEGCEKVSPGCKHCYAERERDHWLKIVEWGPMGQRKMMSMPTINAPLKWDKECKRLGKRRRVFTMSLGDFFEDWNGIIINHKKEQLFNTEHEMFVANPIGNAVAVRIEEIRKIGFEIMTRSTNLDFLVLTKRPENVMRMVPSEWRHQWPAHVWMGTSVENQEYADKRIPHLLEIPSRVHFLSMEPLLGKVDLSAFVLKQDLFNCQKCGEEFASGEADRNGRHPYCGGQGDPEGFVYHTQIDWVIVGGESGDDARPMHPSWPLGIRDLCINADIRFFFKQWGEWESVVVEDEHLEPEMIRVDTEGRDLTDLAGLWDESDAFLRRVGKKKAGRLLDGREWNEVPA